jgi:hypothetical protein
MKTPAAPGPCSPSNPCVDVVVGGGGGVDAAGQKEAADKQGCVLVDPLLRRPGRSHHTRPSPPPPCAPRWMYISNDRLPGFPHVNRFGQVVALAFFFFFFWPSPPLRLRRPGFVVPRAYLS